MQRILPDILTRDEWEAFISTFNTRASTPLRNAALFSIMYYAGLRSCEIRELMPSSIRREPIGGRMATAVKVLGRKRGRDRIVYLPQVCWQLLDRWMERREEMGFTRAQPLFPTLWGPGRGNPMHTSLYRQMAAQTRKKAGIGWRVHPHTLRHTFATNLLEHTGNLAIVQDALGHSSADTTRIYAQVRPALLAEAMMGEPEPDPAAEAAEEMRTLTANLAPEQIDALKQLLQMAGESE